MRRGDESGFTLVEVLAAMVVFAIAATAITAMFAAGLRGSLLTKMDTNAKNLSQQRFEQMRNLPYHIDQVSSGTNPPDLLDTYYPASASTSVGKGAQGFVTSGGTRYTADGDPATGAFYRYVQDPVPGFAKFKQYVATQFVDDSGNAFNPSGFNALVYGSDAPPTITVGVSVTTIWTAGKLSKTLRSYTQITSGRPSSPTALLQSQLTALHIGSRLADGQSLTLDLGVLTTDGTVSETVSAATSARAGTIELSSGSSVAGAQNPAKSPPNNGPFSDNQGPKSLVFGGTTYGSFGSSATSNVYAETSTGQPTLGLSSAQEHADVLGAGSGQQVATYAMDATAPARLGLTTTHAFVADANCGGGCSNVGVQGYSNSALSGSTHSVTTNSTGWVRGVLALLPTTFAPNGLIRVALDNISLSCTVTRTGSGTPVNAVALTYSGSLSYYTTGGYVTVALNSSQATSPLTAAILTGTQVGTDSSGVPLYLSDYFQTWGSMTGSSITAAKTLNAAGTLATASFSGVINVTTVALRPGDDASAVGAQLGMGTCDAEDYR